MSERGYVTDFEGVTVDLTGGVQVVYTLFMDTPIDPQPSLSILRGPDGVCKPAGDKTTPRTFRIFQKHDSKLDELPYKNNGSVLVRMLLDLYFEDKLPVAKMKFQNLLQGK